jgi:hypothetical protein
LWEVGVHRSLVAAIVCLTVAACSASPAITTAPATSIAPIASPSVSTAGNPSSSPSPPATIDSGPPLTAAQRDWCIVHTGGPEDDAHQVEDMAIEIGVIPGAKTREDIFGRWAGLVELDHDITYKKACVAAYQKFAKVSPSPS